MTVTHTHTHYTHSLTHTHTHTHTGHLLAHIQKKERFVEREAVQVTREVAAALVFLHDNGVAHRDLKPQNVLCVKKDQVEWTHIHSLPHTLWEVDTLTLSLLLFHLLFLSLILLPLP